MNYEIDHYEVLLHDYVSSSGGYRLFSTTTFDTDEEAIAFAREQLKANFRVTVRQVRNVVGWWEE